MKRIVLVLGIVMGFSYSAEAATLVGYWNFEELIGNEVPDQSGFGNDGELTGAISSPGKLGRGLFFDGSGGVTVPSSTSLNLFPNGFTFEAWILPTAFPLGNSDFGTIFLKTDRFNPVNVLHFQVGDSTQTTVGRLHAAINGNAIHGLGFQGFSAQLIGLGEWHFVTWTFDNQVQRFFDNGDEVFSAPFTEAWIGNNEVLQIGQQRQIPLHANFYGFIDEAKVYSGALSRDEILRDLNNSIIPEPSSFLIFLLALMFYFIPQIIKKKRETKWYRV
jgi:hypothetical protein